MIAVASKSGQTVGDLLERATSKLSGTPVLAEHVVAVAGRYVGDAVHASDLRFDPRAAIRSLRLLPFHDIPAVQVNDDRVLDVSWRAALDNVEARAVDEVRRSRLLVALPA